MRQERDYGHAEMVLREARGNDTGASWCDGTPRPRRGCQRWPKSEAVENLGPGFRHRDLGTSTASRDLRPDPSGVSRTAPVAKRTLAERQHGDSVLQRRAGHAALARPRPHARPG